MSEDSEPYCRWNGNYYVTEDDVPIVWVDGSCANNGYANAKSGIGCWAEDGDKWW